MFNCYDESCILEQRELATCDKSYRLIGPLYEMLTCYKPFRNRDLLLSLSSSSSFKKKNQTNEKASEKTELPRHRSSTMNQSPWFIPNFNPGLRILVLFLFSLGHTTQEKCRFLSQHGTLGKVASFYCDELSYVAYFMSLQLTIDTLLP